MAAVGETKRPHRYTGFPSHPLFLIETEVLEAAHAEIEGAVTWGDVHVDMAEPIADAIVMALLPFIHTRFGGQAS